MSSTIQIRIEDGLKAKADSMFRDLGTDTTTAIRMFLTQAVANNGFPFEIKRNTMEQNSYISMTEAEVLSRLELSRKHANEGKIRHADGVISDMRSKSGLL